MIKKIAMIALLLCMSCSTLYQKKAIGQDKTRIQFKNNSLEVDNQLLYYTEEFFKDVKHMVDLDSLSKDFAGIYIGITPPGTTGITMKGYNGRSFIVIHPSNNTDTQLRIVMYHELAHMFLNRDHCHPKCDEIMSQEMHPYNLYKDWEEQKRLLFNNEKH